MLYMLYTVYMLLYIHYDLCLLCIAHELVAAGPVVSLGFSATARRFAADKYPMFRTFVVTADQLDRISDFVALYDLKFHIISWLPETDREDQWVSVVDCDDAAALLMYLL